MPSFDEDQHVQKIQGQQVDSSKIVVKNNTVLISKLNPRIPRVWLVKNDNRYRAIASGEFVNLKALENTSPKYLYYFLQSESVSKRLQAEAVGTTNSHTRFKPERIYQLPAKLPSEREQRKIAEILTTVDRQIEKTEALIAKYEAARNGIMEDFFSGKIESNSSLAFTKQRPYIDKNNDISLNTKHWKKNKLKHVSDIKYGINIPINREIENGIPILSLPNINIHGKFCLDKLNKIDPSLVKEKDILNYGDILFNWRSGSSNHLGKSAFFNLEGKWTHVGFLLRIRADKEQCDPKFVCYYINYLKQIGYFKKSKKQVNNTFNSSELSNLTIYLPSMDVQKYISSYIDYIVNYIDYEQKSIKKLKKIKQGLMQDLLTGKVRVNQDKAEEAVANA
jgi:type I restriction enzyme S subunit